MVISCGFLIQNIDGKVLIVHPTNDFCGEGIWCFPKGELEFGESHLDCALREVYEETNIKLNELKGEISYLGDSLRTNTFGKIRKVILYHFKSNEDLSLCDIKCNSLVDGEDFYENDDFKWVTITDSLKYLSVREQNMIIENFKNV